MTGLGSVSRGSRPTRVRRESTASRSSSSSEDLERNLYKMWNRMSSGSLFPAAGEGGGDPQGRRQGGPGARRADRGRPDRADGGQDVSGAGGGADLPSRLLRLSAGQVRVGCGGGMPGAVLAQRLGDRSGHPGVLRHRAAGSRAQGGGPPHRPAVDPARMCSGGSRRRCNSQDGRLVARDRGTPQGSAISPLLANLFMHYAFDAWMAGQFPTVGFERYCDDVVVHCRSEPKPTRCGTRSRAGWRRSVWSCIRTRPASCTARTTDRRGRP